MSCGGNPDPGLHLVGKSVNWVGLSSRGASAFGIMPHLEIGNHGPTLRPGIGMAGVVRTNTHGACSRCSRQLLEEEVNHDRGKGSNPEILRFHRRG